MLSKRATETYLEADEFLIYNLNKATADPYRRDTNPEGYLNLGTSVNALCEDLIEDWLNKDGVFEHKRTWQHYTDLRGHIEVRQVLADFLNRKLDVDKEPVLPENLRLQTGASTLLESLAFAIGDEGDVFVTPLPTYSRFFSDVEERARVRVMGPVLREANNFQLKPEMVDNFIRKIKLDGANVKAYIHCNPTNPLGDVYDQELTRQLMEVCKKHEIHFISDEIYAFSVFNSAENDAPFKSVLSMENLPDPQRVHFVWGLSKDFGLASFRFGVVHSLNQDLLKALDGMVLYTNVGDHIQHISAKMLSDKNWLDQVYFPTNLSRLKAAYDEAKAFFESFGLAVRPSRAGLFVWVDFRSQILAGDSNSKLDQEREIFRKMIQDHKIYMPNGTEFGATDPGWFRAVIAVNRETWEEFARRFSDFARANFPDKNNSQE